MADMSSWHRWDLQVHTPCSVLNNQFGDPASQGTWDTYIDTLEQRARTLGVVGVGITDYFTVDGYRRLLRERECSNRLREILLIPNIELRIHPLFVTDQGEPSQRRANRVNFHILFSPDLSPDTIEQDFLWNIKFCYSATPSGQSTNKSLRQADLEQYGRWFRQNNLGIPEFQSQTDLQLGMDEVPLEPQSVRNALHEFSLQHPGSHLAVVAGCDMARLPYGGQAHSSRTTILQMSHAVFSSNHSDRDHYLGLEGDGPATVINELGSLKPCLWGSDAHSLEKVLMPDGNRYCWIKSDPTWDGLRQVVLEPEDRVAIQDQCPEPVKSTYTVKSISVPTQEIASGFALSEANLSLSPGLVTLVGGRGSGKTALLDLLASAFPEGRAAIEASPGSFVKRIVGTGPDHWTGRAIKTHVVFADDQILDCTIGQPDQTTDPREGATADYLPQDRLDQITGDPIQLQDEIRNLVFEQSPVLRTFYQDVLRHAESIDEKQHLICGELDTMIDRVAAIPEKEAACSQLRGELLDVTQRMAQTQTTTGEDTELDSIVKHRDSLSQDRTVLQSLIYEVSLAAKSATHARESLLEVSTAVTSLANQEDKDIHLAIVEAADALKSVDSLIGTLNEVTTSRTAALASIVQQMDALDQQQKNYEGAKHQLIELANRKSELEARAVTAEKDLSQLQQLSQTGIPGKVDNLIEEFEGALRQYHNMSLQFVSELMAMSARWSGLLEGLRFDVSIKWNRASISEQCLDDVNKTKVESSELERLLVELEDALRDYNDDSNHSLRLRTLVSNVLRLINGRFRKGTTLSSFLTHLLATNAFSLWLEPALDGVALGQLSMGGRAVVLLKIVLAQGDYPLILDQPEQGLDNNYVFEKLVPAIREAKRQRQIIIATHNANLVVNTDAEQVIVARCNGETIGYTSGSLENPEVRDQVATLLEGGMDALRRREQRYELKFD